MKNSLLESLFTDFSKKLILYLLAIACLFGCTTPKTQIEQYHALQKDSKTTSVVYFDRGIPAFVQINIPHIKSLGKEPLIQSLAFLSKYNKLYGLNIPPEQLYLKKTISVSNNSTILFGQNVEGIPVWKAEIAVYHHNDSIIGTSGRYIPDMKPLPNSLITAEVATKIAKDDLSKIAKDINVIGEAKLFYFNNGLIDGISKLDNDTRLCYQIIINGKIGKASPIAWIYFIDTYNKQVIHKELPVDFCFQDKDIFRTESSKNKPNAIYGCCKPKNYPAYPAPNKDNKIKLHSPDPEMNFIIRTESNGNGAYAWFDEHYQLTDYPKPNGDIDKDGKKAEQLMRFTYNYFRENFSWCSYQNGEALQEVMVDAVPFWNNAMYGAVYAPYSEIIYIPDSKVDTLTFIHEYTHGITEHTANFGSKGEQGALNEGFSDAFAYIIGNQYSYNTRRPWSGCIYPVSKISDVEANLKLDFDENNDFGCRHGNAELLTLISKNIAEGYSIQGIRYNGIGKDKTGKLFFDVLTGALSGWGLTSSAGFNDFAYMATVISRLRPDIYTASDRCTIRNALAEVGLGSSDLNCDGVDDSPSLRNDFDGDGFPNLMDNCPETPNISQSDMDGDGKGDACDDDIDGDGYDNSIDNCPTVKNPDQKDLHKESKEGDACGDLDGDGITDLRDNCVKVSNREQYDFDGDGIGDACDDDDDNDNIPDIVDKCPFYKSNNNQDSDGDGWGDVCDNCPSIPNPNQADYDQDGIGNICDDDDDNDSIADIQDNCPWRYNPDQVDLDHNGVGSACDFNEIRAENMGYITFGKYLNGLLNVIKLRPIRIPFPPCITCPPIIPENYMSILDINTPFEAKIRIIDDRGDLITSREFNKKEPLSFKVNQSYYYMPPDKLMKNVIKSFTDIKYFIEIIPSERVIEGKYPISFGLRSGKDLKK